MSKKDFPPIHYLVAESLPGLDDIRYRACNQYYTGQDGRKRETMKLGRVTCKNCKRTISFLLDKVQRWVW